MLGKVISINRDDFILLGAIVAGTFVLVQLVTCILLGIMKISTGAILILNVLIPVVMGFVMLFSVASHIGVTFDLALRMGRTRRNALGLTLGVAGMEMAAICVLAVVLTWLDRVLAGTLWKICAGADAVLFVPDAMEDEMRLAVENSRTLMVDYLPVPWWVLPLTLVGAGVLGIISGAVIRQFGRKGFWTLWGIWMAACILLPMFPLENLPLEQWGVPGMIVVGVVLLIWSVWSLLHTSVRT